MGIVYKTKSNHIFDCEATVVKNGVKYAIDTTEIQNVKAYPLSALTTLGTTDEFIMHYYDDYSQCDEVAALDDLDCLIGNECCYKKTERLSSVYGSDPEKWHLYRDEVMEELFSRTVADYKKQNNGE